MKSKSNVPPKKSKPTVQKKDFWQTIDQFLHNKWVIGVMLVIVSFVYNHNYSNIYDRKIDLNGDNIYYYSLGQALSHGEGYTNIISLEKTPHSHFPPGYPWFISKILKISPDNIQAVKKALIKRDLIDVDGDKITFNDSLFKLWLKRQRRYLG